MSRRVEPVLQVGTIEESKVVATKRPWREVTVKLSLER